jgi:hypothetical protein
MDVAVVWHNTTAMENLPGIIALGENLNWLTEVLKTKKIQLNEKCKLYTNLFITELTYKPPLFATFTYKLNYDQNNFHYYLVIWVCRL